MGLDKVIESGIPVLGTVTVAVIGGFAGWLTAGWKVRELRVKIEQERRDRYLENARTVAAQVYVPLAIAMSKLNSAYLRFRNHVQFEKQNAPEEEAVLFRQACLDFDNAVRELMERGATAYLTLPLEEQLSTFALYIRESLIAKDVMKKATLQQSGPGVDTVSVITKSGRMALVSLSIMSIMVDALHNLMPFVSIMRMKLEVKEIASPIASREFEREFQKSTFIIGTLIKQVTLDSKNAPEI